MFRLLGKFVARTWPVLLVGWAALVVALWFGVLLQSRDRKAELVAVELNSEFLDSRNWPTVDAVERLVGDLKARGEAPDGLDVALTGSAVLGRDTGRAEERSAAAVQRWTILV